MWIEFITNTECNWDCRYCNFDKVENVTFDRTKIDKHAYIFEMLDKIAPEVDLTYLVQGGEIGLIEDNNLLSYFLSKFNKKVIIDTNGTFMEIDRSALYPYIDSVFYHVIDHTENLKKVKLYDLPIIINHGIVDDNAENILKFIDYNDHVYFEYVDFEANPANNYTDADIQNFYSMLAQNIRSNMRPELIHEFNHKGKRTNFVKEQLKCRITDQVITVDLARELLCSCTTKGCTNCKPLTSTNLFEVLTGIGNFNEAFTSCDDCYRSCFSMNITDLFNQKRTMKQILSR